MKKLVLAALILASAVIANRSVFAVELHFSGYLHQSNSQSGQLWGLESVFPIGTPFTGSFTYDPQSLPFFRYENPYGTATSYAGSIFTVEIGGATIQSEGFGLNVIDGAYAAGMDQFTAWSSVRDYSMVTVGSPIPADHMAFGLYDQTGSMLLGESLPSSEMEWSGFSDSLFMATFFRHHEPWDPLLDDAYFLTGTITSIWSAQIPSPATFALLFIGMAALTATQRRRLKQEAVLSA